MLALLSLPVRNSYNFVKDPTYIKGQKAQTCTNETQTINTSQDTKLKMGVLACLWRLSVLNSHNFVRDRIQMTEQKVQTIDISQDTKFKRVLACLWYTPPYETAIIL